MGKIDFAATIGPEAPMQTNEHGAVASAPMGRFDLIPPHAVIRVARVLLDGLKDHPIHNWRGISFEDHVNHGLQHIFAMMAGDASDDHIGHAATRFLMALELEKPTAEMRFTK